MTDLSMEGAPVVPPPSTPTIDLSDLPPDLATFRSRPLPTEEEAKALEHMARMLRIQNYGRIKHDYGKPLTVDELRHCMILLGAQRAETLRQKRSDSAQAKKASAGPVKQLNLEDL